MPDIESDQSVVSRPAPRPGRLLDHIVAELGCDCYLIEDQSDLEKLGTLLTSQALFSIDTETGDYPGPDGVVIPSSKYLRLIQIYFDNTVFIVDVLALQNAVAPDQTKLVLEPLRPALVDHEIIKVAHNQSFELARLAEYDIVGWGFVDTMPQSKEQRPDLPTYSLQGCVQERINCFMPKEERDTNWMAPTLTAEQYLYAARDAILTYQLYIFGLEVEERYRDFKFNLVNLELSELSRLYLEKYAQELALLERAGSLDDFALSILREKNARGQLEQILLTHWRNLQAEPNLDLPQPLSFDGQLLLAEAVEGKSWVSLKSISTITPERVSAIWGELARPMIKSTLALEVLLETKKKEGLSPEAMAEFLESVCSRPSLKAARVVISPNVGLLYATPASDDLHFELVGARRRDDAPALQANYTTVDIQTEQQLLEAIEQLEKSKGLSLHFEIGPGKRGRRELRFIHIGVPNPESADSIGTVYSIDYGKFKTKDSIVVENEAVLALQNRIFRNEAIDKLVVEDKVKSGEAFLFSGLITLNEVLRVVRPEVRTDSMTYESSCIELLGVIAPPSIGLLAILGRYETLRRRSALPADLSVEQLISVYSRERTDRARLRRPIGEELERLRRERKGILEVVKGRFEDKLDLTQRKISKETQFGKLTVYAQFKAAEVQVGRLKSADPTTYSLVRDEIRRSVTQRRFRKVLLKLNPELDRKDLGALIDTVATRTFAKQPKVKIRPNYPKLYLAEAQRAG